MKEIPAPAVVSGFVAIVVQPDPATIRASYALAASLMPADPVQTLAPESLPHVTLTQCAVRDAPREHLGWFVTRLDARLRGISVPLRTVTPSGGGFLFWCVEDPSPARTALQRAHEDALAVADGILDPVTNAAVVAATVETTANDPVLVANAREFGYAFIRDRYLPHITLGFDPRLRSGVVPLEHRHTMTIERVVLGQLGPRGRVDAVFTL